MGIREAFHTKGAMIFESFEKTIMAGLASAYC